MIYTSQVVRDFWTINSSSCYLLVILTKRNLGKIRRHFDRCANIKIIWVSTGWRFSSTTCRLQSTFSHADSWLVDAWTRLLLFCSVSFPPIGILQVQHGWQNRGIFAGFQGQRLLHSLGFCRPHVQRSWKEGDKGAEASSTVLSEPSGPYPKPLGTQPSRPTFKLFGITYFVGKTLAVVKNLYDSWSELFLSKPWFTMDK